jgi:hypothetical protein
MTQVKETLEVIALGLEVARAIGASLSDDGKINFADLAKFGEVAKAIMPAIADIKLVPQEITSLNETGMEEIKIFILDRAKEIPGINEKWLTVASGALKMGMGLLEVIEAMKK